MDGASDVATRRAAELEGKDRMEPILDVSLLRTFVAVDQSGGFTSAAERLGLSQSTVSLQIKRLEDGIGKVLFERDRRGVTLTIEGELLLDYATRILDLNEEAVARISEGDVEGTVRLGTPEDFATQHLPSVLAAFSRSHPKIVLEVDCDLTLNLLDRFGRGQYDLVLVKREPQGPLGGVDVWKEPLVWTAQDSSVPPDGAPVPLVVSPRPCVYRHRAVRALEQAGRSYRVVYTSPSLAGTQAAVRAGLGVTVLPQAMVPTDFAVLKDQQGFPNLRDTEIALYRAPTELPAAAQILAQHITSALEAERLAQSA